LRDAGPQQLRTGRFGGFGQLILRAEEIIFSLSQLALAFSVSPIPGYNPVHNRVVEAKRHRHSIGYLDVANF